MTIPEAARMLGLSPSTVGNQVRAGRLRSARIGNIHWIDAAEVERYRREVLGRSGKYERGK